MSTNCRTKRRAFGAFAKGERHIVANSDKERKQAVKLIHGVSVKDVSGVFCEYALDGDGVRLTLSAQDYKSFFVQAVGLLKEPLFFFLECPGGSGGDASGRMRERSRKAGGRRNNTGGGIRGRDRNAFVKRESGDPD